MARTAGSVNVLVTLNAKGDVVMVKPISNTLGDRPGASDLVNAAILSAAASTFAPQTQACQGVKGTYIFSVEFKP